MTNTQLKQNVANLIAQNAYNGIHKAANQITEMFGANVEDVELVINALISSGKIEVRLVQDGNPFTGSQRTSKRYLPVIDGKGRGYSERHLFSKKQYISAVM